MRHLRQTLLLTAGVAALTLISVITITFFGQGARSQAARTIKLVVPFPPGGAADVLARILGEQITRAHGPTILVENRPGAGGAIGTEVVSRAPPDGNTLLVTAPTFVTSPHLRQVNYDAITSFEPICQLTSTPSVLLVNSSSSYRTLGDLLDAARAKPGSVTLASVFGGPEHLAFERLKRAANVNMTFVPYPGGAPAVNALLGSHVTAAFLPYSGLEEQVKAGKLRVVANASRTRSQSLPDVPTIAESGFKDYEVDFWNGLLAPAKTPKQTVSQLAIWFTAAMQVPAIKAKIVDQGFYPVGLCGDAFGALLRKQYGEFGRVIREANIKAE